jgi:hypothetical protein
VATLLAAISITLLSWHTVGLLPQGGLDASWGAGLHMAAHNGLGFGDQIIFTYGPLGFLTQTNLYYSDSGIAAFVYRLVICLVFAGALFAGARRSYLALPGFVVALIVASGVDQLLEAVALLIIAVYLLDRSPAYRIAVRRRLLVGVLVGAFAGIELLLKESVGIQLTAMAAVLALALPGRRLENAVSTAAGWAAGLLAGWLASGQSLGALPHFAHNAARIVSGYAAAMGVEYDNLGWQYAAGWLAFLVGLAAAWHSTATRDARTRYGTLGLWTAFSFFAYKEGFVRHDLSHGAIYFEALAAGFLAFRWRPGRRWVGLGFTATLFVLALTAQQQGFSQVVDPSAKASAAVDQAEQVFTASKRRFTMAQGRATIRSSYPIDPGTLALLRGHTVHVAPVDAAVAWAYGLRWQPLPVFQSYTVYTTGLDAVNAAKARSNSAPQRILEDAAPPIDSRYEQFDASLTTRAILCRYAELRSTGAWAVLGAGPDRCSPPVAMARVSARWDQAVPVPAPPNDHSFVYVRIGGVAPSGFEVIRGLVYKPLQRTIRLDGSSFRLIAATAADGLVLRAPVGVDFNRPFNVAPNPNTISVGREGGTPGGRVTYAFYAQSVSVGPRSPGLVPGAASSAGAPAAAVPRSRAPAGPTTPAAVVDAAQFLLAPYCAHPPASPPPEVVATARSIVKLVRREPAAVIGSGHFAGQTVRQVAGEFAGLLNAGCAPGLGSQIGGALRAG